MESTCGANCRQREILHDLCADNADTRERPLRTSNRTVAFTTSSFLPWCCRSDLSNISVKSTSFTVFLRAHLRHVCSCFQTPLLERRAFPFRQFAREPANENDACQELGREGELARSVDTRDHSRPRNAEAERRAHCLEKRRTHSGSGERPPRATDPQNSKAQQTKWKWQLLLASHGVCDATVKIPRRNFLKESDPCVPATPPTPERQCPRW